MKEGKGAKNVVEWLSWGKAIFAVNPRGWGGKEHYEGESPGTYDREDYVFSKTKRGK